MRKINFIFIFFILITFFIYSQDSKEYYNTAVGRIKEGNYNEALIYINKALQLKTDYKEAYFARGYIYYQTNKINEAISDFSQAIKIDSKLPDAYYHRALCYYQLNDYKNALNDFNKTIELVPDFIDAYNKRANIYFLLDNYELAIKDYDKSLSLLKTDFYSYFLKLATLIKISKERYEKSRSELKEKLKYINDEWQKSIAQFFVDAIDKGALLSKADSKEKLCEAYYYIGVKHLSNNEKDAAKNSFINCINTNVVDFTEYKFAKKELSLLK